MLQELPENSLQERNHKSSDTSVNSHDSGQFSSSSANSKRKTGRVTTTQYESTIGYKLQGTFFKNTRCNSFEDLLDDDDEINDFLAPDPSRRKVSCELSELHIYMVPVDAWQKRRGLAEKDIVENCISLGFVRVLPDLTIADLRSDISAQLETEVVPRHFVFVRGVGRHFTEVKKKQEQLLKVRNFLPPQSQEPEIFLLEKLVNQAAEADQRLESVAKAQGQTSDGFLPRLDPSLSGNFDADTPEKLKLQEELFRLRSHRKDGEAKKEHLLNRAKVLQARAASHKAKLAGLWEEKLKEEQTKTGPLEEVCAALREALDAEHKKRMEAFENKMKPIIIKDGPSKKANYKINAAKLYYEIYSLSQRLRLTTIRVEHEEEKRERAEREVRRLREEISVKKTAVTTATKGIPVNKIEVRPQEQQPNFSGPTAAINPMLVGLSNEAQLILATSSLGGAASPVKQLLEANAARGLASIEMDRELQEAFGTPPQPPSRNQQTPQGLTPLPRSAKITMDEAAEAAVDLAKPANSNYGGKMPNGRPPAIETGTN